MGKPKTKKKPKTPGSKLSPQARAAIARTRAGRAALDAAIGNFVDEDPTPVMVLLGPPRRLREAVADDGDDVDADGVPARDDVAPVEKAKRTPRTRQAKRSKKPSPIEERADKRREQRVAARAARREALDVALDNHEKNGASVAREVTESLKPVMRPPTSLHGVRIG